MPAEASSSRAAKLIVFVVVFIDLLGFGVVIPVLPRYGEYFAASRWLLILLMASTSSPPRTKRPGRVHRL